MSSCINEIVNVINKGGFKFYKTEKLATKDNRVLYKIIWNREELLDDTLQTISIDFVFDMKSFLDYCKGNIPEFNLGEESIIKGLGMFFSDVASIALSFGKDNYFNLANYLLEKKTAIFGHKFNL